MSGKRFRLQKDEGGSVDRYDMADQFSFSAEEGFPVRRTFIKRREKMTSNKEVLSVFDY